MSAKSTYSKKNIGKTIIIIAGIIIAIVMSVRGPIFKTTSSQEMPDPPTAPSSQLDQSESSGSTTNAKYHSGARLLEVFTKNLPYLNNK